jgi:hypothetical protein
MKIAENCEILSFDNIDERNKWQAIASSFKDIDIFYYPNYLKIFELHGDGKPYLFVYYSSAEDMVIYPFLKRNLKEIIQLDGIMGNTFDITSPYGYGGYLRNTGAPNMEEVYAYFHNYCVENKIISEFVRFHPLIQNHTYFPHKEDIYYSRDTVVMDLSKNNDEIWMGLKSSCRRAIRKARNNTIDIMIDDKFEYLDIFYDIYTETMQRLGAHEYYFFKKQWFHDLVTLLNENVYLMHAVYNREIISSGIFLFNQKYSNYYLGGSRKETQHLRPNNLLLYEAALQAKLRGCKYFQLGGGYELDDSLMQFKLTFSNLRPKYYIAKIIHLPDYYDYICEKLLINKEKINDNYFPIYRAPKFPEERQAAGNLLLGKKSSGCPPL